MLLELCTSLVATTMVGATGACADATVENSPPTTQTHNSTQNEVTPISFFMGEPLVCPKVSRNPSAAGKYCQPRQHAGGNHVTKKHEVEPLELASLTRM